MPAGQQGHAPGAQARRDAHSLTGGAVVVGHHEAGRVARQDEIGLDA